MAGRSYGTLIAALLGGMLTVACTATAVTPTVAPAVLAAPPAPTAASAPPVRLLQLNLCSSGIASCYTGRAADEAAAVIRAERPDVVTLNEACRNDLAPLEEALAQARPGETVTSAFQAARNGPTGEPYQCRNGEEYGNGIVARWPSTPGSTANAGIFPAQDPEDPEQRAWLCLDLAAGPAVAVCTTHLAYTDQDVAIAQCRYLFDTVIGQLRAGDGARPVVVGGDLNLGASDSPLLASCLPNGSTLVDDGGPQRVVSTPEFVVADSRTIDLNGATDHPGLLVDLAPSNT